MYIIKHLPVLSAKEGSMALQALSPDQRKQIIHRLADLLIEREEDILTANRKDMIHAQQSGMFHCEVSTSLTLC